MKNYFANVRIEHRGIGHYPIRWNRWSPDSIIFKSNRLIKKIMPKNNILSYKSKGDRDQKTCKKLGCKVLQQSTYNNDHYTYYSHDKYTAVHVHLKDLKSDYVGANVDFIDYNVENNKDSVGNRMSNINILSYINSMHQPWEYSRCPQTNQFIKKANPNVAPLEEGYRMAYGGQGEGQLLGMTDWDEYLDICKAIRMFLYEVATPANRGEFDFSILEDLMVA